MPTTKGKKATKRVKDLPAKALSREHSKHVRGGDSKKPGADNLPTENINFNYGGMKIDYQNQK